jgi:hypothetical protein
LNQHQRHLVWRAALYLPGLALVAIGAFAAMDDEAALWFAAIGASLVLCGLLVGREPDAASLRRLLRRVRPPGPIRAGELMLVGQVRAFAILGVGLLLGGMDTHQQRSFLVLASSGAANVAGRCGALTMRSFRVTAVVSRGRPAVSADL